jgi:hypothetical protein
MQIRSKWVGKVFEKPRGSEKKRVGKRKKRK